MSEPAGSPCGSTPSSEFGSTAEAVRDCRHEIRAGLALVREGACDGRAVRLYVARAEVSGVESDPVHMPVRIGDIGLRHGTRLIGGIGELRFTATWCSMRLSWQCGDADHQGR